MSNEKRLSLKEVFFLKEEASTNNSRFVEAMRKQFSRAQTQQDLDYMASAYDQILQLAANPDPKQREDVLRSADAFFKFHFRLAYSDIRNGVLDVNSVPSGKEILDAELEKRKAAEAEQLAGMERNRSKFAGMSDQERGEAERRAVYGGDVKNPWGLGS